MNEINAVIIHLYIMHNLGAVNMLLRHLAVQLCFAPSNVQAMLPLAGMLRAAPLYRQMLHVSFVYLNICTWPTNHMQHARLLTGYDLQILAIQQMSFGFVQQS